METEEKLMKGFIILLLIVILLIVVCGREKYTPVVNVDIKISDTERIDAYKIEKASGDTLFHYTVELFGFVNKSWSKGRIPYKDES
jgi:hypothetical protein